MSSAELVKEHREEEEGAPAGEDEDTGAQVAPIVKLEEVAVTTGEEDEDVILDLKAKLYRFDKEVNQWKERGAGTVKFLKHKETKKVRLVMRQSKTLKICANHLILPTMTVQEHAGNEKSCLWHAKDFADGELKDELFCIRFASLEITERSRLSLSLPSSLYHSARDYGSIFRFLEDSITPSIPKRNASTISTRGSLKEPVAVRSETAGSGGSGSTPCRRRLRSDRTAVLESSSGSLITRKSPRQCINSSPNTRTGGLEEDSDKIMKSCKSPVKRLSYSFAAKQPWNPKDPQHMSAVKEALHVSTVPCSIVCREDEQQRILEFCKGCIEQEKAGSLYICGCPGTGKSLSMEKVKQNLLEWAQDAGLQPPDVLSVQCTSLATTSEIFSKILGKIHLAGRANISTSSLQHLQKMYTQKQSSSGGMMLIIADELDYLITKDRAVLHDLFMLTALPFSRCILIGIANAIDLADRFLPTLQSLNCKPLVLTFRAYSKDQILQILQERLMALPYVVFQPQALELCARKIAAASGDMRKALCICRSAIDLVEAEAKAKETAREQNSQLVDNPETSIVKIDHMAFALSRTFRSPAVDTIQSLPQHQQITICSTMKLLRRRKKDATLGELYKSYLEVCKESPIPAIGIQEFSSICQVLNDQGLLKLGQSRDDKLRKIALKVEEADIVFALQGVRFFRNCLQQLQ